MPVNQSVKIRIFQGAYAPRLAKIRERTDPHITCDQRLAVAAIL